MRGLRLFAMVAVAMLALSGAALAATAGDFTVIFNGVQYNQDPQTQLWTSTWTYTVTWHKSVDNSPGLSHFNVQFCPTAKIVSSTPKYSDTVDGSMKSCDTQGEITLAPFAGIKWDGTIPEDTPTVYTFTLDGKYAVGTVHFATKAATLCNIGTIEGPALDCSTANPAIDLQKHCLTPDVFLGDTMLFDLTVINSGNVALTNVVVDDPALSFHQQIASMAAGEQRVFQLSKVSDTVGPFLNTATASGSYWGFAVSDADSCTTNVWALQVAKTAVTTFHRDYDWSATNTPLTGDPTEICHGDTKPVPFEITVTKTSQDSGWTASGNVMVTNPSPVPVLVSLQDQLSDNTGVPLSCGVTLPYMLPGGATITCSYSIGLTSGASLINTATAMIPNGTSFHGTAAIDFSSFTSSDPSTTVTVTVNCPNGFQCTGAGPWTVTDSGTIDYNINVTNVDAMCNTYFQLGSIASWVDDDVTKSASGSATIKTCACPTGCTLTIGYWKTHAGFTGNNPDNVTQYLPIWLGTEGGAKSVDVVNASMAVSVLSMELGSPSNGITKLYAQLLGSKFNFARGAWDDDILKIIGKSDIFLAGKNAGDWASLSKADRTKVISWMSTLDAYNNGIIGPGHCN